MRYTLLVLSFFAFCSAGAQTFPVQVTTQLNVPYSLTLSDYASSEADRIVFTVFADVSRPELQVKFRLRIQGQNVILQTKQDFNPSPVIIQGGIMERFTGFDLAAYFDPANLTFQGITRQQFQRTGKLPEGLYQFQLEVFEYNRNIKISNTGIASGWLILNDPPLVNLPRQHEKLRAQDPQNVVIQWTPRHTGSPNAAFKTEYEVKLVEVWPSTRNPNDAILTSQPIFETTTSSTTLIYGPAETPLEPGRSYALRIQAKAIAGVNEVDLFKNNGYSEVVTFVYGDACDLPTGIKAEAISSARIGLQWQSLFNHTSYSIKYRVAGSNNWYESKVISTDTELTSLKPATRYEYQVAAGCGPFNSTYSPVAIVTTKEEPAIAYSCGLPVDPFNLDPAELAPSLKTGDIIQAGDFNVTLAKVEGSNGTFSGEGVIVVPYFNKAKVKTEFTSIKVNKELRMVAGEMKVTGAGVDVIPSGLLDLMDDLEEGLDILDSALNVVENNLPESFDPNSFVADTLINVGGGISSVYKDDDGTIVIVDNQGNEQRLPAGTSAAVTDSSGTAYLVDSKGNVHKTDAATAKKAGNREYNLSMKFAAAEGSKYGFDEKKYVELAEKYETINGKYDVAWKALSLGQPDKVVAKLEAQNVDLSKIRYELGGQTITALPNPSTPNSHLLQLTGMSDGEEGLLAMYSPADTSRKDQVIGKLNVVTYKEIPKTLVVVPVNGNTYQGSAGSLATKLNVIYNQAVVQWSVSIAEGINVPGISPFDDGESGLLTNYTPDMKKVINAYKDKMKDDVHYIFLVSNPKNNAGLLGYMPRSKPAGFVFVNNHSTEDALVHTIAHELGHGAFNLQHTFSDDSKGGKYQIQEGTTDNLMDYTRNFGTRLYKHQWDKIRYNDIVIGMLEEDEEGQSVVSLDFEQSFDEQASAVLDTVWFYFNHQTRFVKIGFLKQGISVKGNNVTYKNETYTLLYTSDGKQFSGFYNSSDLRTLNGTEHDGIVTYTGIPSSVRELKLNEDYKVLSNGDLSSHTPTWIDNLKKRKDISKKQLDELASLINRLTDESLNEQLKSVPSSNSQLSACGGAVDIANLGRTYSTECWDKLIKQLKDLMDGSQKRINDILSLINKSSLTEIDKENIKIKFRELKGIDYGLFKAEDRIKLLSYFTTGNMIGTYFGNANEEGFALKIIKYADANQADYIISNLEKVPAKLNDAKLKPEFNGSLMENLSLKVNDGIWGIGKNNAKALTNSLVYLLSKSVTELKNRLNGINPEVIFVQNSYLSPSDNEVMLQVYYKNDGGKEISISQGRWVVERKCEWKAGFGDDGYEECTTTRQEIIWDTDLRLNPFDLIVVAKESDITLIEGIDPIKNTTANPEGSITVVPSIVAYYANKEGDMRNIGEYVANTLDVVTIVVPFSKIASAPKWLNRLYKFTDVISKTNSAANLTVNNTGLKDIPQVREVLDAYNKFTIALNVANLVTGVSRATVTRYIVAAENKAARRALRESADAGNETAKNILECSDELKRIGESKTGNKDWWKTGLNNTGKAGLLTKFKDFTNIKSWINSLDDVVDASLLSKLDNLDARYFTKFDADLVHATYGPEIKALLKESPDDLEDIWKRLKDDPAYSWELQKTGGSRWEKWGQREFFKDITAKGKGFETNVCLATFKNRSSAKYLELKQKFQTDFGKNLDDYDMYSQVQLKYDGDNYFVADQLFVKRNALGDIDDLVVIENKLSSTTPLTTPQSAAFTMTSFTVRSQNLTSQFGSGANLTKGKVLNFSGTKQWYKVYDGANGDMISGISKMQ
jgi:hypothetical protein